MYLCVCVRAKVFAVINTYMHVDKSKLKKKTMINIVNGEEEIKCLKN